MTSSGGVGKSTGKGDGAGAMTGRVINTHGREPSVSRGRSEQTHGEGIPQANNPAVPVYPAVVNNFTVATHELVGGWPAVGSKMSQRWAQ